MEEIIYFELDNWFCGRDYPNAEPFISWMCKDYGFCFGNDEWCKENKLCVEAGMIDMSTCFCVTAPKSWIEKNCPKLLTDEECGDTTIVSHWNEETQKMESKERYEPCQYSKFICKPNEYGDAYGHISGWAFREYKEENFGVHWNDLWWGNTYDLEEDEEDKEE